jgi:hypothetical protein
MELKIVCQCGQKIKFDVEPVNGQMPFTVICPVCTADGTTTANARLAEFFAQQPPAPMTVSAPPSAAPVPGRLRINRPAPVSAPAPETPEIESAAPTAIRPLRPALADATNHPAKKPNFAMGMLGGFIGAAVGVMIYFLIFKFTGLRIKLLAIGVGALAGWLAELFGKGEGSKELGGITAVFVLAGIIGAQYFVARDWWHESTQLEAKLADTAYTFSVTEAKEAMKIIPTGSDSEIRTYLAKKAGEEGDRISPATISNKEVSEFRENRLPEYRALASGEISKEKFLEDHNLKVARTNEDVAADDNTFKGVFLLLLLSKVNLFSLAAAAGLAFKLSTNA